MAKQQICDHQMGRLSRQGHPVRLCTFLYVKLQRVNSFLSVQQNDIAEENKLFEICSNAIASTEKCPARQRFVHEQSSPSQPAWRRLCCLIFGIIQRTYQLWYVCLFLLHLQFIYVDCRYSVHGKYSISEQPPLTVDATLTVKAAIK